MNILKNDIQMDFANSFTLGYGFNDTVSHTKLMRTIGNSMYYNLEHNRKHFAGISSIYILNFHGRNQFIGAISATVEDYSLNYYNDGGFAINFTSYFQTTLIDIGLVEFTFSSIVKWA